MSNFVSNSDANALMSEIGKKKLTVTDVMPLAASAANEGIPYLYLGATTQDFTNGSIYECQEVTPATDPKTYEWVEKYQIPVLTLWADCPLGTINAFGGTTAPEGWLLCQGQALSRTEYKDLFDVIGTAYGSGDGSTTFNLPDMREAAPVGAGTNVLNAGSIATHDAYNVGQFKDDQVQSHNHDIYSDGKLYGFAISGSKGSNYSAFAHNSAGYTATASIISTGRNGTTTHGKQVGVNYIMKVKQTPMPADLRAALEDFLDNKNMLTWG